MLEFLAVAMGPKHCDLEIKDLKFGRTIGRLSFDLNIQQVENMEISLDELFIKLNGKEERPLYS
jgi:hypothetical protein